MIWGHLDAIERTIFPSYKLNWLAVSAALKGPRGQLYGSLVRLLDPPLKYSDGFQMAKDSSSDWSDPDNGWIASYKSFEPTVCEIVGKLSHLQKLLMLRTPDSREKLFADALETACRTSGPRLRSLLICNRAYEYKVLDQHMTGTLSDSLSCLTGLESLHVRLADMEHDKFSHFVLRSIPTAGKLRELSLLQSRFLDRVQTAEDEASFLQFFGAMAAQQPRLEALELDTCWETVVCAAVRAAASSALTHLTIGVNPDWDASWLKSFVAQESLKHMRLICQSRTRHTPLTDICSALSSLVTRNTDLEELELEGFLLSRETPKDEIALRALSTAIGPRLHTPKIGNLTKSGILTIPLANRPALRKVELTYAKDAPLLTEQDWQDLSALGDRLTHLTVFVWGSQRQKRVQVFENILPRFTGLEELNFEFEVGWNTLQRLGALLPAGCSIQTPPGRPLLKRSGNGNVEEKAEKDVDGVGKQE